MELDARTCTSYGVSECISVNDYSLSCGISREGGDRLPVLCSLDYYTEPCLKELAKREVVDPGYTSRVPDFTVGRLGYGYVKFLGNTDIRWLDLDQIVKFHRHEVVVYEDEASKPVVGQGLNKAAEVTLFVDVRYLSLKLKGGKSDDFVKTMKEVTERQGARFIAFDPASGEWKFLVDHFSRFGLSDDEDDDVMADDVTPVKDPLERNGGEVSDVDEVIQMDLSGPELSHSLPAHLGLDPVKMNEMRMVMFQEEEEIDDFNGIPSWEQSAFGKGHIRSPLQNSTALRMSHRSSPPVSRKTPLGLLEYHPINSDSDSPGMILMAQQNKGLPLKKLKTDGFKLDLKQETPVSGSHSQIIVDAGLFMGRAFRVGWGPNGVLLHSGAPVGSNCQGVLSSIINVEKVAIDKVVRDESNKVSKKLVEYSFDAPLNLHKQLNHETEEVEVGSSKLKLQKVVLDRFTLSEICRSYTGIIEAQLDVPGISLSSRTLLIHQVIVWELIKVLFSERENSGQSRSGGDDNEEDMMEDVKDGPPDCDLEALPLIRRAQFSCWLKESVCHRVQDDVSSLDEFSYLKQIFLLLTGRQLDSSVELAASKGDVRLACLLSQAGGSMLSRSDCARQLDLWRINGLDFKFIEKDRIRLYELLAGHIHSSLNDVTIDWKRFLGLLMWYQLPPDTPLPVVFRTYQNLLEDGKAPLPVPIYVDEGPTDEAVDWSAKKRYDLSYYLMLLHASGKSDFGSLKTMFSAFSSTYDPLDYHMIWHQREVLEAVGAFSSNDLQILDMGYVSQLLCQGQCHWAIYVVLHMPRRDDYPYLQATLIREMLCQYCEFWSSDESQRQFIEELGIPLGWLHEAMAVYFNYYGDLAKALEHFLECGNWQKAHSIFITSVAHTLFLSANHSEVWTLATSMESHKSEIENWDLGAGLYISFYLIKSSLHEDNNTMSELNSLESKNGACNEFLGCLKEALEVWGDRLPLEARVTYSKMAEEVCDLLLSDISQDPTRDAQLSCFETVFSAPVPEDIRSIHLQDAVSLFTCYLSEIAS